MSSGVAKRTVIWHTKREEEDESRRRCRSASAVERFLRARARAFSRMKKIIRRLGTKFPNTRAGDMRGAIPRAEVLLLLSFPPPLLAFTRSKVCREAGGMGILILQTLLSANRAFPPGKLTVSLTNPNYVAHLLARYQRTDESSRASSSLPRGYFHCLHNAWTCIQGGLILKLRLRGRRAQVRRNTCPFYCPISDLAAGLSLCQARSITLVSCSSARSYEQFSNFTFDLYTTIAFVSVDINQASLTASWSLWANMLQFWVYLTIGSIEARLIDRLSRIQLRTIQSGVNADSLRLTIKYGKFHRSLLNRRSNVAPTLSMRNWTSLKVNVKFNRFSA